MAITRSRWVVLVVLLVGSSSLVAQKSPLAITGSVSDVVIRGLVERVPVNKDNFWEGFRHERKTTEFQVSVYLQYCNRGDDTLIVPTRYSFPNERRKILFLELPSLDSKISGTATGIDHSRTRDPMPEFLSELEKPEPSRYKFAIIEPGQCHESRDMIFVNSGYKLETRPSGDRLRPPIELASPEHSYFKIQYSLSMKDSLPTADAKRRWSSFGELLTTSEGDFFFETDFIINKLPD